MGKKTEAVKGDVVSCPDGLEDLAEAILVMELQFFVQSALSVGANAVLSKRGYGRAHHRALYFVARQPGITSPGLAQGLGISAQALAKVMNTLIADGLVRQETNLGDRRVRRLYPTAAGLKLLRQVFTVQAARLNEAVNATSAEDLQSHIRLYKALVDPHVRLIDQGTT